MDMSAIFYYMLKIWEALVVNRRIKDLRKTYRNPEKIYNPKTVEELSVILQKLIL